MKKEIKEITIEGEKVKLLPYGMKGKTFYGKKAKTLKTKKKFKPLIKQNKLKPTGNKKLGRFIATVPNNYVGSYGEEEILKVLKKCNIQVLREVTFEKMYNRRFDFYIPSKNTLIEFDGKQHFEYVEKFDRGDKSKLIQRNQADREKDNFAKKHSLRLVRISYKQVKEIETILGEILF